ncbi:hypothetical protein GCM10010885_21400 [Alicyclobacillus cellulosilyticus]|uniref:Uncharacterized protein n=1 Tax=Alicyclobacillus cellulosilyticus TaxID=1003997 RepID=A0A917KHN7_9BACL|nr:spore germination protein [Alicyclobacillus cellulosilyticus]GGJ11798.1 hypothetical protein GCM10010885_21400 [Alicyclobacillus cellulosilyticus]
MRSTQKTTQKLVQALQHGFDVIVRPVPEVGVDVVYVSTIADLTRVEERLLGPILRAHTRPGRDLETWLQNTLQLGELTRAQSVDDAACALLESHAVICTPRHYFVVNVQGPRRRTPEEPAAEIAIRGPRDGFTESIETNASLIRTRLRDRQLVLETFIIGDRTRTKVLLAYIADGSVPSSGVISPFVSSL